MNLKNNFHQPLSIYDGYNTVTLDTANNKWIFSPSPDNHSYNYSFNFNGTISETSFDGKDVIFKIGNGSLTVKDGKGKKLPSITKQKFIPK